jgi:ankyrin repeat protein
MTPLDAAARAGGAGLVALLLDAGADVHATNYVGEREREKEEVGRDLSFHFIASLPISFLIFLSSSSMVALT